MRETWGELPRTSGALPEWATQAAMQRAETDPRVTQAVQNLDAVTADREAMRQRHEREQRALLVSEYGAEQVRRDSVRARLTNPHRQAAEAHRRAAATRSGAEELRSLPINDAARRIEAKHAAQEHAEQRAAERARQLRNPFEHDPHRSDPHHEGPTRGL